MTPLTVGSYFEKINCFCFTEQTMAPGETREMPVVFYVDPSIVEDRDKDTLNTITLSYTFYPVRNPAPKPLAAQRDGQSAKETCEGKPPVRDALIAQALRNLIFETNPCRIGRHR